MNNSKNYTSLSTAFNSIQSWCWLLVQKSNQQMGLHQTLLSFTATVHSSHRFPHAKWKGWGGCGIAAAMWAQASAQRWKLIRFGQIVESRYQHNLPRMDLLPAYTFKDFLALRYKHEVQRRRAQLSKKDIAMKTTWYRLWQSQRPVSLLCPGYWYDIRVFIEGSTLTLDFDIRDVSLRLVVDANWRQRWRTSYLVGAADCWLFQSLAPVALDFVPKHWAQGCAVGYQSASLVIWCLLCLQEVQVITFA